MTPQPQLKVIDGGLDPKQHALAQSLQDALDMKMALEKALTDERKRHALTKRELDDYLEQSADAVRVKTCLKWWRDRTGRDARTKLVLTGQRAKCVRWVIRTWGGEDKGARAFCLAVIGLTESKWHTENKRTDIAHMCMRGSAFDEGRVEEFIQAGRHKIGER